MKQKLSEMVQVTVLFHTNEFIFVWSFKNGNGRQNRSSGAKTRLLRRAGAKTWFPGDTRNARGRRGMSHGHIPLKLSVGIFTGLLQYFPKNRTIFVQKLEKKNPTAIKLWGVEGGGGR